MGRLKVTGGRVAPELHGRHHRPQSLAETVHNRMPVILASQDFAEWLDRTEVERPPVHLLRPFPSNRTEMHSAHQKWATSATGVRRC